MEISNRIKEVRLHLGFQSQEKFAQEIGVKRSKIADIEAGNTKNIPMDVIISIVEKFHIDGWWLQTGRGKMISSLQNVDNSDNAYQVQKLTCKASAGGGNSLDNIEVFNTGEYMSIDRAFFKTPPSPHVKVIQVDGYSMVPVLLPDSWVIFEECPKFKTDGLYIVNYGNELMVKLLQMHPNGKLEIVSANKDYKSYEIDLRDNQEHFRIVGKVIRSII